MQIIALRAIVTKETVDGWPGYRHVHSSRSTQHKNAELPNPQHREFIVNRFSRVLLSAGTLVVVSAANAEAQLPDQLQDWLQPLSNCRTLSCIITNIPTTPPPNWPTNLPWIPAGSTGPITTTPEPLTMALLGTGLVGIAAAARRRKQENGELV
jgi:hypothetical protein